MGNIFGSSSSEIDGCVGAYTYNPCWVCPLLNPVICCGHRAPVWREGGGFQVVLNDGQRFTDPAWAKGSSLRQEFEAPLLGEKMREVLLGAPKDRAGGMLVHKLAPILNQKFCTDINEKLLISHGFRCEARFWHTQSKRNSGGRPEQLEHFALAVFKLDGDHDAAAEVVKQA